MNYRSEAIFIIRRIDNYMHPHFSIVNHLLIGSPNINLYPSLSSLAYLPESPGKITFFYLLLSNLQWLPNNYTLEFQPPKNVMQSLSPT